MDHSPPDDVAALLQDTNAALDRIAEAVARIAKALAPIPSRERDPLWPGEPMRSYDGPVEHHPVPTGPVPFPDHPLPHFPRGPR